MAGTSEGQQNAGETELVNFKLVRSEVLEGVRSCQASQAKLRIGVLIGSTVERHSMVLSRGFSKSDLCFEKCFHELSS